MKKIVLSTFAMFSLYALNAQISLTNAQNAPTPGDSYSVLTYDTVASLQLNLGANQTWDFSSNTSASTGGYTIGYVNASFDITSPAGTTVIEMKNNQKMYYKNSTNQLEILGYTDGTNRFSVPEVEGITYRTWPFANTNRYTDAGLGTYNTTDPNFPSTGPIQPTASGKASGYGTLIVPNGTSYSNVLLVVDTFNYDISFSPQTNVIAGGGSQMISYKFYSSNFKYPVLNVYFTISTQSAINTATATVLLWNQAKAYEIEYNNSESLNSIEENSDDVIGIFPNPANDNLNISLKGNAKVEIVNTSGIVIQTLNLVGGYSIIDISNLVEGVYFVKCNNNTKKLIKK